MADRPRRHRRATLPRLVASVPKTVAAVDATARPIQISFQERIRSMSRGAVHVAYLYESTDHSTFRYRVSNVVDALNAGSKRVTAAWFLAHEWHQLERLLPLVDVLVVCRCRYSYIRTERSLVTRAHARGIDVIYDVDDLVVDTDVVPLLAHTLGETDRTARGTSGSGTWAASRRRCSSVIGPRSQRRSGCERKCRHWQGCRHRPQLPQPTSARGQRSHLYRQGRGWVRV